MSLESTHPFYDAMKDIWVTMRDLFGGERVVKAKRDVYLPPTPSMILDGFNKGKDKIGEQVYCGYLKRAQFPGYVADGIEILVGMLNHKPATIELPSTMEDLRDSCTLEGESLQDLLRKIHTEQLTTGRLGLLTDLPVAPATGQTPTGQSKEGTTILPYIALYVGEAITNWDQGGVVDGFSALNLVILNESTVKRDKDFTWKQFKKYRVLQLGSVEVNEATGTATYKVGTFDDDKGLTYSEDSLTEPAYRGKRLEEIPFTFINTKDLLTSPDKPPLEGLGSLVLAIYRGEADYRQGLFMTGQDTLVVIGGTSRPEAIPGEDDAVRTGAGSRIDVDINGDAKYIGVESNGLSEQRECLENDHKRAATKSGQLLPSGKSNSEESGEALKTRLAAQTASLTQIAMTAAKGLEVQLKTIASWIGADPEKVIVKPNLEFGDLPILPADITALMTARMTGAPISKKSIHGLMVEKRLTSMTFEEEMEQIKEEDADMPRVAAGATTITADEQKEKDAQDREDKLKQQQIENKQNQNK